MPLLSLIPPSQAQVHRYLQDAKGNDYNYKDVRATMGATSSDLQLPDGWLWQKDNVRVKLGQGKQKYARAKSLLQRWAQFQLGWSNVDPDTKVEEGAPVAVVAKTLFLWTVNPLRITYVQETQPQNRRRWPWQGRQRGDGTHRWQFAHGCLQGHMLAGEESFKLEWDPRDDSVWYEVLTFSRPVHPLALISYPLTRYFQYKFGQDSVKALLTAIQDSASHTDSSSSHFRKSSGPIAAPISSITSRHGNIKNVLSCDGRYGHQQLIDI